MKIKKVLGPALLVILFGTVLIQLPLAIAARAGDYDFFDPIIDVRALIVDRYVESPDEERMLQAAIAGMIETLDDPHTIYVPPRIDDFNKDLRGTYVGIGAEVNIVDDYLTIVTPMDDSPALAAGILAGDVVLEIEGESTYQVPINESIAKLLGEPDTPVRIKVRHIDGTEADIEIVRRRIVTTTVRGLRRDGEAWNNCLDEDHGIQYVRVTQFNHTTIDEFEATLRRLVGGGMRGLVLDLRDNPGGELPAAIAMSDLFLEEGTIVSVRDRRDKGPMSSATADGTLGDFPIVVLVNGASASASEIVSGALQENGRARVLGTRTHGKGSVQEVRELPLNRGTLKITTAYYYLPSGRNIHRRPGETKWGVDPDYLFPITTDQYVERMRARRDVEIIRGDGDEDTACAEVIWVRETLKDGPLAEAAEILAGVIDGAGWPETADAVASSRVALEQERDRYMEIRNRRAADLDRLDERIEELGAKVRDLGTGAEDETDDAAGDDAAGDE